MADNQDLDLTFLYEIADGSNEFIVESIDMFMQQSPELLHLIDTAITAGDWPAAASSAHKLKPNLGFFGMIDSQSAMQEIEHLAKTGAPDVHDITTRFNEVRSVITGNLRKLQQIKTEAASQL
ncbi:Hpt domain-containing protein [Mucilaginibacter jinjuensis]|jgi:HPt (histidine-containing phosphotransfer) domain-containing protein|uniref:Hpt domain-containing protein n=1 Tax=Mucilaginibacter jinjuensis TaxID=1176721 RepID=A0ABY7TEX3_9SPHI|nr:Hpt domain-containing protein [Mucilaginibacter jinjuensis]WCT14157.1 Hpt domain-containing protein [Mucilaginibacter jinjuensis]